MRPRTWLLLTITITFTLGAMFVVFNIIVDPYGLYRATRGRQLIVYGDPRVSKYLLNFCYVPENFNALLVGSSFSSNWDMTGVEKLRVYNDSLDGGNIVEEKALVDAALSQPGISVAFVAVHPALTYSHEFETATLVPSLRPSSLGSRSLWEVYKEIINLRLRRVQRSTFDYAGTEKFALYRTEMNVLMKRLWDSEGEFEIDPVAWTAYRELIRQLRRNKVRIVFVVPPTYEGILARRREAFDTYVRLIRTEMATPEDVWIDFTAASYLQFRSNRSKFNDGVHFYPAAAKELVSEINLIVKDRLGRSMTEN